MKTKINFLVIAFGMLITLFASEKANAQIYFNGGWANNYSGYKICNAEEGQIGYFTVQNPSADTMILNYIKISMIDTLDIIDSIYLLENGSPVSRALHGDSSIISNMIMLPFENKYFDVWCKIKISAKETQSAKVNLVKIFSKKETDTVLSESSTTSSVYSFFVRSQNCSPVPIIFAYTKNLTDTVCKNDEVWANASYINYSGKNRKEEWLVNGNLINFPSYFHYPMWYWQNLRIPLSFPTTSVVLKTTDDLGRVGYDSILLHVLPNPTIRMTATSKYICAGSSITMELKDTVGISGWAWDWTKDPIKKDTLRFPVNTPGQHGCTISSINGCSADTSITFYQVESPSKPGIIQNEWILSSSTQADSIAWKYGTTTPPNTLKALNKAYVDGSLAGYYQIESYNKYGCSSKSDIGHFNGWTAPDSMPHVKLIVSSPRVGINTCDKDSIIAMRQTKITKAPIKTEHWYLNGNLINFLPSQIYDGMTYRIPLNSSTVKLMVVVTDTLNHITKDSVILNVMESPNTKFTLSSNNFCKGNSVIAIGDTIGGKTLIWDYSLYNQVSKSFNTSGIHTLKTTSITGCTKDTIFEIQEIIMPEKPVIAAWDTIMICSDADSVVWRRNNIIIQTSSKTELTSKISGIYTVEVFNKGGCSKKSDPFTFTYVAPVIAIDSSSVRITTNDNFPNGNFCKGDFHPNLNFFGVNTNKIQNVGWYVNDSIVYLSTNPSFLPIVPAFIKLDYGMIEIKVRIQMQFGKVLTDSISFPVIFTDNSKINITGSSCKDSIMHASINFIDGASSVKWYNNSISATLDVLADQNKIIYATITTLHGCVTYTDTITIKPITIPQPLLSSIKCELYADVNTSHKGYYMWYSNHNLLDTSIENHFTVNKPGYYQVKYKSEIGCASESISTFADCSTTGISESNSESFKVYPNPFTDRLNIDSEIGSKIVFIDINGKVVYEGLVNDQHTELTLDVPPGIYVLQISNGDKTTHRKIVRE